MGLPQLLVGARSLRHQHGRNHAPERVILVRRRMGPAHAGFNRALQGMALT